MASTIDQDMLGRPTLSMALTGVRSASPYSITTRPERFLLLMTIAILPLEAHIPTVAGFSSLFLMFAFLAGYVLVNRRHMLDRVWMQPVFVAAYIFAIVTVLLEFASPLSSYEATGRFALMIGGAILVASLCRDRPALKACLHGYIVAALWLSIVLFMTTYGSLSGVATTDFDKASKLRAQVYSDRALKGNLNGMALTCAQGGIAGFALALASGSLHRRMVFFVITLLCLVASFLPMSRMGAGIGILSCGAILYAYGVKHGKSILIAAILAAGILLLVPDAIWSRMTIKNEEGAKETRAVLYDEAWRHSSEYLISGVGFGNFVNKWGLENGFAAFDDFGPRIIVVHNTFLQVTIFWGLIGLLPFLVIVWQAYRCLPQYCGRDVLAVSLLGIAISLLMLMPFSSEIYYKGYSLGLGMLVAARFWIWPSGIVEPVRQ